MSGHHHHGHGGPAGGVLSTYAGITLRLAVVACASLGAVVGGLVTWATHDGHAALAHVIVCYIVHWLAMPIPGDVARLNVWLAAKRLAH